MKLRTIISFLAILTILSAFIGGFFYYSTLQKSALEEAHREADIFTELTAFNIDFNLTENQKAITALAGLREIHLALANKNPEVIAKANSILDNFQNAMTASVCYIMDSNGKTIASSNRNSPKSFVGKNYSFRPYFRQAVNGNPSIYMALGITSGKRGGYFSHPVYGEDRKTPLGVAVIKASIERIEKEIDKAYDGLMMLTDPHGVVFASSQKEWLYKVLWQASG